MRRNRGRNWGCRERQRELGWLREQRIGKRFGFLVGRFEQRIDKWIRQRLRRVEQRLLGQCV
jgi:hypothetical protein